MQANKPNEDICQAERRVFERTLSAQSLAHRWTETMVEPHTQKCWDYLGVTAVLVDGHLIHVMIMH